MKMTTCSPPIIVLMVIIHYNVNFRSSHHWGIKQGAERECCIEFVRQLLVVSVVVLQVRRKQQRWVLSLEKH